MGKESDSTGGKGRWMGTPCEEAERWGLRDRRPRRPGPVRKFVKVAAVATE